MGMQPSISGADGLCAKDTPGFVSPKLAAFDALWRERDAIRHLPRRSDFSPRMLAPFLTNLTFVERIQAPEGRRWRHRLFGTALTEKMGNCTGKYLEEMIPAHKVEGWSNAYDQAIAGSEPLRFLAPFGLPGLDFLMIETLLAPIAADDDTPFGFLGVAYFFARVTDAKMRDRASL
ncbi:MAG TPA: PAS domain-containing protein [Rhizomicrobium sp.]